MEEDWEVILVEQGISHKKSIERIAWDSGLDIHYHFLKHPSMTHARNVGVVHAKGEYVLFLDDDVVARPNLIKHHIKNFKDSNVVATCGRVITKGQDIEAHRRDTARITLFGTFTDGYSSAIKQEVDTVAGCNMCWRSDVLVRIGGFDENFTGNALREESDVSLRAKKAGYRIIFEPKAVVDHIREESGGARKTEGRMQWYFDFFSNETYFFLKHRPHYFLPVMLLLRWEWMLRCMFGFGREVSLRSFVTPFKGIYNGIEKYRRFTYDHRN